MLRPTQMYIDLLDRLQARRELRKFKHLLNNRATSLAVALVLSGSLQAPRFSSRWLA